MKTSKELDSSIIPDYLYPNDNLLDDLILGPNNKKLIEDAAVLRYDVKEGFYVRFSDGRWMIHKDEGFKEGNKFYYVPRNYKKELNRDNLKELDKRATGNIEGGGKLVEIVLKNGKEQIAFRDYVEFIEKIIPMSSYFS